jgi:hypothetical protein
VRTLVRRRAYPATRLNVSWNGRDAAGRLAPEGVYHPRVELHRIDRAIEMPNEIELDTTPPSVSLLTAAPLAIVPDGDGRREAVLIRYRLSERAQVSLLVDGRRALLGNRKRRLQALRWFGKVGRKRLPAGRYRLDLVARDEAGNRSSRSERAPIVRISYGEGAR